MRILPLLLISLLYSPSAFSSVKPTDCNDDAKVYKVCHDQLKIFHAAAAEARKKGQIMLLQFGADWCVWCVALHKILGQKDILGPLQDKVRILEIGVRHYASERSQEKIVSAEAVITELKVKAHLLMPEKLGLPYLVFYDPSSQKAIFQDTEPLEQNTATTKGHSPTLVKNAVAANYLKIKAL